MVAVPPILKVLKLVRIFLLVLFVLFLLFYLGIVIPEYLACLNINSEGGMGTDIWGSEVQCFGDSKAFGEMFFQLLTCVAVFFIFILLLLQFLIHHLKRTEEKFLA